MIPNYCNQFLPPNVPLDYYGDSWICFNKFYSLFHEVSAILVIMFGFLSNISLMVVLTRKKMSSPSNIYLIGISIADTTVLIIYFFEWLPLVVYKDGTYEYILWFTLLLPPYLVFRSVSNWLTVFLAVWRVISIYTPFQTFMKLSNMNAIFTIVASFGLVPFLFIPNMFSFRVDFVNCTFPNGRQKNFFHVSMISKFSIWLIEFRIAWTPSQNVGKDVLFQCISPDTIGSLHYPRDRNNHDNLEIKLHPKKENGSQKFVGRYQ